MRLPLAFDARPTGVQLARAGAWEEAWSFPVDRLPGADEVRRFLAGGSELAIEAFFADAFIGARFNGRVEWVEAQALRCIAATEQAKNGSQLLASWIGSASDGYAAPRLAYAEVGATNAWASAGAFRIDDPAQALRDLPALLAALSSTPMDHGADQRPALELSYTDPVPHWIGIPLSVGDAPHELDADLLRLGLEHAVNPCGNVT